MVGAYDPVRRTVVKVKGKNKEVEMAPCVRCGHERQVRPERKNSTGMCRDCLNADPRFGRRTR